MSYEDLVTMKAFLMALKSLNQPLPENLQIELDTIAEDLPASAYELCDLAERYEPLNQYYLAALKEMPSEGERLKFAPSAIETANINGSDVGLNEGENLIQQLHHQIDQVRHQKARSPLLIKDLGWTPEQIAEARFAFSSFQEDWDDPAMEVYDDL